MKLAYKENVNLEDFLDRVTDVDFSMDEFLLDSDVYMLGDISKIFSVVIVMLPLYMDSSNYFYWAY